MLWLVAAAAAALLLSFLLRFLLLHHTRVERTIRRGRERGRRDNIADSTCMIPENFSNISNGLPSLRATAEIILCFSVDQTRRVFLLPLEPMLLPWGRREPRTRRVSNTTSTHYTRRPSIHRPVVFSPSFFLLPHKNLSMSTHARLIYSTTHAHTRAKGIGSDTKGRRGEGKERRESD